MTNETTMIEKWHLAENGIITAWVPQKLHTSNLYSALRTSPLKPCYTGKTNGIQLYSTSDDGISVVDGISIEYEYSIPLTQLKQRKVKWQWQGLYDTHLVIEFDIEKHIQEYKDGQSQTLQQINDIIKKLNEPPKTEYYPHNFRLSEGIVLCQQCGELLADLKKTTFGKGCAKI
jgi:hypothetical protein